MGKNKTLATALTKNFILSSFVLSSLMSSSPAMAATNFWGGGNRYAGTPAQGTNGAVVPIGGRSFFKTTVEEVPGGFKLIVDLYHGELNMIAGLDLQVAVNDGNGEVIPVPVAHLSDLVADNPEGLHSRREYVLHYDQLNAELAKVLSPAAAQKIKIGPGSALFVIGQWPKYFHTWGGLGRGGIFYAPGSSPAAAVAQTSNARPKELDLAYPITMFMAFKYNKYVDGQMSGLKLDGQIRSRLEKEGKFQVPLSKADEVKKQLYALANNPSLATQVLGPDWTVEAQLRYMKKDAAGNLILDGQGLPIPDPMIDTYYDNARMDAAKNDVAIRYRWTEGNGTGAWNIKPGRGRLSKEGAVSRIEYGLDTTDDKPETVMDFANSTDALNPFQSIRDVIPGAVPSDFLKPALKITDTRYKFKMKHKNGLVIEVSLDDVHASSLRQSSQGRYVQLEMDVDHLSTSSANVATHTNPLSQVLLSSTLAETDKQKLAALTDKAFLDGTPAMHNNTDLSSGSEVMKTHQADFDLSETAIVAVRKQTLGEHWLPAPQKASLAAFMLGMVRPQEAAGSVQNLMRQAKRFTEEGSTPGSLMQRLAPQKIRCDALFN